MADSAFTNGRSTAATRLSQAFADWITLNPSSTYHDRTLPSFRHHHRDYTWRITYGDASEYDGATQRILDIESDDGNVKLQCRILDYCLPSDFWSRPGQVREWSIALAPNVLGIEFPIGTIHGRGKHSLDGGHERVPHGIVHSALVRCWIDRWAFRRRYRIHT